MHGTERLDRYRAAVANNYTLASSHGGNLINVVV
jgi:hypothetical protein